MDFSKLSILIVEDVEPMQRLLEEVIITLGVGKIYKAANGNEGYRKYLLKQPDIIITDWHMPEVDGLEFLKKIRRDPNSPHRNVPVIMISGLNASARITKARDLGVTEYLVKPFNAEDLAKRISHIINKPRDFIISDEFCGPDRRRNQEKGFEEERQRFKAPDQVIKAETYLQEKIGKGQVNPNIVSRSETIMEKIEIDFTPMAKGFLDEFKSALKDAEKSGAQSEEIKDAITFSVMQLKANAYTFKYNLVGELSNTTLEFLESTNEIDSLILEILNAQHATLTHLVNTRAKGDGGTDGITLRTELKDAYKRYNNAKTLQAKDPYLVETRNTQVKTK